MPSFRSPHARSSFALAVAIATGALAVSAAAPDSASARRVPSVRETGSPPDEPGHLTLHNASADSVRVEVRIGTAPDCDADTLVAIRMLPPGRRWTISTTKPVCWRRVSDGATGAGPGLWQQQAVTPGQRTEATL